MELAAARDRIAKQEAGKSQRVLNKDLFLFFVFKELQLCFRVFEAATKAAAKDKAEKPSARSVLLKRFADAFFCFFSTLVLL